MSACVSDTGTPPDKQTVAATDTATAAQKNHNSSFAEDISEVVDTSDLVYEDGAILIDWKMLSDVTFEDEYNEEVQAYVPYPTFGAKLRAIEQRTVQIKGYIIPLEETGDETILVLSAQPYSSCFFCGGAGPESVMDIKLEKKDQRKFITDERLTFRGRLRLNDSDLYYLNYILEEAVLVD
jgi:hypothetical protein